MEIRFDCPHCGLGMEASMDSAGGAVQCPGCSQEFVVEARPPVVPVVVARAVPVQTEPPAPSLPATRAPQYRPGPAPRPQSFDRPRYEPPVRESKSSYEEKMPYYGLGVAGAMLIGLVVWLGNRDSKPKVDPSQATTDSALSTALGSPKPEAAPEKVDAEKAKLNSELKAIKDALAAKEERDAALAKDQERKENEIQEEIRSRKQEQRDAVRDQIAQAAFDGDSIVADAYLKVFESVMFGLSDLMHDGDTSNDPKSEQEAQDYVVKRLIAQFKANATLNQWTTDHQRDLEKFVPELVRKSMRGSGSVASANNFDFSKYRSMGSGFFVSSDGWILTNEHVVKDSKEVDLRLHDGKLLQAKVVKVDETNDLALLKVDLSASSWLAVSKGTMDLQLGRTVFTVGYPDPAVQGVEPKFTDGRVSAASGIGDRKDSYQTTVPVQHGNSGGALVDFTTGWVVGVVNAKLESRSGVSADNVSYAIKGNVVSSFLESVPEAKAAVAKISPKPVPKGDERAVIDRATDSSVLILRPR